VSAVTSLSVGAVWWHQHADVLESLARGERDDDRAGVVWADAVVARRIAQGLGCAHVRMVDPLAQTDAGAVW
jgi:hypothetical protein